MPSDAAATEERAAVLRDVLRTAQDPLHSALARTIEEVRTLLDARPTSEEEHVRGAGAALGAFAGGRVDPKRFSALLTHTLTLDDIAAEGIERAFAVLRDLNERLDSLVDLRVSPGTSLRDAVDQRLAQIGCAFGAAHVVTAIRAGKYDEAEHAGLLTKYPFARWSAAERALAPALLVEVDGADVRAPALSEFLDGSLRVVLSVTGPCPVAPLARLIAPRTFVQQTDDAHTLDAFVAWQGTAIGALVPSAAARFCHVPAAAGGGVAALEIVHLPDGKPQRVGAASTNQQLEDLELLTAWKPGVDAAAPSAESAADDSAGRLASWLLQQADLTEAG